MKVFPPSAKLLRTDKAIPPEADAGKVTTALLALMIFLAPTLGVPHEEMLQDTLKSMIVAGVSLFALTVFWWHERQRHADLRWHALMWLPLALMAYALGSMVWSHRYLAAVEAIRWGTFSVILFLGLNSFGRDRFTTLAWGIHAGAFGACVWTALQFWCDLQIFPQGPNPASTFVNRNFFAEFAVCTLPFSTWLILRMRGTLARAGMGFSTAFNVVALLMTGTRSALVVLLVFLVLIVGVLRRYRTPLGLDAWRRSEGLMLIGVMLSTVLVLGLIPSTNPVIQAEFSSGQRVLPLARGWTRAQSIADPQEYRVGSFSIRWVMWSATARMIAAHPVTGVGAGAWEVQIPKFEEGQSQLETDFYAHNEMLQLLAEYGLLGWVFLLSLFAYLTLAAWRTWRASTPFELSEAPLRSLTLLSLLSFLMVSQLGFPWRMASTGALFALCLGILAASDARLCAQALSTSWIVRRLPWRPRFSLVALSLAICALALCVYISLQAQRAERSLVHGVKLALTISQSRQVNSPRWDDTKEEIVRLVREGVTLMPHYRKLTPMVADELARWGDWQNAVWIWESVIRSRPYVVALMTNAARGYAMLGNLDKAQAYLVRSEQLKPDAPSVRSLRVVIHGRLGQQDAAYALTKKSLAEGIVDYDLSNAAYILGKSRGDWDLALQGLQLRTQRWSETAADAWLKTGDIYADPKNPKFAPQLAQEAYRNAFAKAREADRSAVRAKIPEAYREAW